MTSDGVSDWMTMDAEDSIRRLVDVTSRMSGNVDSAELLAAMATLRDLRVQLGRWEPDLIGAARDRGVTWNQIAPALGLASRQAADTSSTTREDRVQATRDERSGDRAVAAWARENAADLRRLAGQVSAAESLSAAEREDVDTALGGNDAADLVTPLSVAGPSLRGGDPALADRIDAMNQATDDIRTADRDRRRPAREDPA
jgi:hypothetical protein